MVDGDSDKNQYYHSILLVNVPGFLIQFIGQFFTQFLPHAVSCLECRNYIIFLPLIHEHFRENVENQPFEISPVLVLWLYGQDVG